MLTKEQVLVQAGTRDRGACGLLDGRDYVRLCDWFTADQWPHFGFKLKDGESDVVRMWLWVLENAEFDDVEYQSYGLPLLEAVAEKYGLPVESD